MDTKKLYRKGIGVLSEIILSNIKKERLNLKELVKSNNELFKPVTPPLNYFLFIYLLALCDGSSH